MDGNGTKPVHLGSRGNHRVCASLIHVVVVVALKHKSLSEKIMRDEFANESRGRIGSPFRRLEHVVRIGPAMPANQFHRSESYAQLYAGPAVAKS